MTGYSSSTHFSSSLFLPEIKDTVSSIQAISSPNSLINDNLSTPTFNSTSNSEQSSLIPSSSFLTERLPCSPRTRQRSLSLSSFESDIQSSVGRTYSRSPSTSSCSSMVSFNDVCRTYSRSLSLSSSDSHGSANGIKQQNELVKHQQEKESSVITKDIDSKKLENKAERNDILEQKQMKLKACVPNNSSFKNQGVINSSECFSLVSQRSSSVSVNSSTTSPFTTISSNRSNSASLPSLNDRVYSYPHLSTVPNGQMSYVPTPPNLFSFSNLPCQQIFLPSSSPSYCLSTPPPPSNPSLQVSNTSFPPHINPTNQLFIQSTPSYIGNHSSLNSGLNVNRRVDNTYKIIPCPTPSYVIAPTGGNTFLIPLVTPPSNSNIVMCQQFLSYPGNFIHGSYVNDYKNNNL